MRASLRLGIAVASSLALALACGGGGDLTSGSSGDDGGSQSGDDSGGGSDGGGNQDGATDSGSGGDGNQNNDSGNNNDGGQTTDGGGGGDGSSGDQGIVCGQTYCQVQQQVCCVSGGQQQTDTCQAANQPCTQGDTTVHCDDTTDCPNGKCCGTFQNQHYVEVVCAAQCQQYQIQFCDPNKPDCPPNTQCRQSQYLQGFHICR